MKRNEEKERFYSCDSEKDCKNYSNCLVNDELSDDQAYVTNRKTEILKYIKENRPNDLGFLSPLVDDVVDLEMRLTELRKKPTIEIHPSDSSKQRVSPYMRTYKELLQQYNNCLRIIILKANNDDSDEESPLRVYMKQRVNMR